MWSGGDISGWKREGESVKNQGVQTDNGGEILNDGLNPAEDLIGLNILHL